MPSSPSRPPTGSPRAPTARGRGSSACTSPASPPSPSPPPGARSPDPSDPRPEEEHVYRILIDRSLCSGFGACAELAPDVFELDAGGTASARGGESEDPAVLEAAVACPMAAITIIE